MSGKALHSTNNVVPELFNYLQVHWGVLNEQHFVKWCKSLMGGLHANMQLQYFLHLHKVIFNLMKTKSLWHIYFITITTLMSSNLRKSTNYMYFIAHQFCLLRNWLIKLSCRSVKLNENHCQGINITFPIPEWACPIFTTTGKPGVVICKGIE